jgi:hypothetical protein
VDRRPLVLGQDQGGKDFSATVIREVVQVHLLKA